MAFVISRIITGAPTISFSPLFILLPFCLSFQTQHSILLPSAVTFTHSFMMNSYNHDNDSTQSALWKLIIEYLSLPVCLSLSPSQTHTLSVFPLNTKTTEVAHWCEKFGCELSVECSDKAINAWLADTLGEAAVVFLWNPFSDHSDCVFATLGRMLLVKEKIACNDTDFQSNYIYKDILHVVGNDHLSETLVMLLWQMPRWALLQLC